MHLLDLDGDGRLRLTDFDQGHIPPYAILSHTWEKEEVVFRDVREGRGRDKTGYRKIGFCLGQARRDGLQYCWVDACCIDKANSTELSEAINSMFRWYARADRCYVYLSDVPAEDFRSSRWFTRGWTLQELLAPSVVEFFSSEGARLGDKVSLIQEIHERTQIPTAALHGEPMGWYSIEERMSWMARRQTRREEDMAYSLLGIFDVSMPLIYGEGRRRADFRLRKCIREAREEQEPGRMAAGVDHPLPFEHRRDTAVLHVRDSGENEAPTLESRDFGRRSPPRIVRKRPIEGHGGTGTLNRHRPTNALTPGNRRNEGLPYEELQADIDELRRQKIRLEAERDDLHRQLHHKKADDQALIQYDHVTEVSQMQAEMTRVLQNRTISFGQQEQDERIFNEFTGLLGRIRNWSVTLCNRINPNRLMDRMLDSLGHHVLVLIAPNKFWWPRLYGTDKTKMLIQGLVMYCLKQEVFDCPFIWAGRELGDALNMVHRRLSLEKDSAMSQHQAHAHDQRKIVESLHDWRALTAHLVSSEFVKPWQDPDIQAISSRILDHIMKPLTGQLDPTSGQSIEKGLLQSIHDAVALSELMCSQRAAWAIRFPPFKYHKHGTSSVVCFDPQFMTDVGLPDDNESSDDTFAGNRNSLKTVSIVTQPCLYKRGDIDGENYGQEFCVRKAEVWCRKRVFES